jgi:DNA-binding beta-propeller fold protein YncE
MTATRTPRLLAGAAVTAVLAVLLAVFLARGRPTPMPPAAPEPPPVLTAAGPTLVVANQRCGTVTLIDVATGKIRVSVGAEPCPHEVAVSPDGATAAVASYGLPFGRQPGNIVKLIDVATGRTRKTIDLGEYTAPHGVHWLDDNRLLCTCETARALVEIDTDRGEVVRVLDAGPHGPHLLAVSADRTRAYSANLGSNTVTAFDLVQGVKLRDVEVGKAVQGVALSPDGRWLWAGSQADRAVSVIDTDDLRVVKTLPAPGKPYRIAFSPDGQTAVVTEPAAGELAVYDTASLRETKRIRLGRGKIKFDLRGPAPGPNAVAFAPDGKVVYCTMFASNAVAAVDLATGEVVGRLSAGLGPDGIGFVPLRAAD